MILAVTMILARMKELLLEKSHMDIANVTRNASNLSWHKRTLSEVKPSFVICKKAFKRRSDLVQHQKTQEIEFLSHSYTEKVSKGL